MNAQQRYYRTPKGKAAKARYARGKRISTDREYAWKRHGIDMDYQRYIQLLDECGTAVSCALQKKMSFGCPYKVSGAH